MSVVSHAVVSETHPWVACKCILGLEWHPRLDQRVLSPGQ